MSRADYVAAAYAYYDGKPRDALVSTRVQAWRADPATVEFFRDAAGFAPEAAKAGRAAAVERGGLIPHSS
jgi:hypothetical protein